MKFKFLAGDVNYLQYGGKWVSKKLNNGEFNYWLVMELINMWDATGDTTQPKYAVELRAVAPSTIGEDNKRAVIASYDFDQLPDTDDVLVEIVDSYGIHSLINSWSGNNARELMKQARREANISSVLFGFYMDRPQNRIGQSGWDCIRGQDIREHLANIKTDTVETTIIKKMCGMC